MSQTSQQKLSIILAAWESKPGIMLPCAGSYTTEQVAAWIREEIEKSVTDTQARINSEYTLSRIADTERLKEEAQDILTDIWFHFSATDDPTLRGIADRARALLSPVGGAR